MVDFTVLNVNSVLGLNDGFLESLTEIFPFSHESLSLLGGKEFLVKSFDGSNLFGMSPSLEGVLNISDSCGVFNFFPSFFDISGFFFNGFLTFFGY